MVNVCRSDVEYVLREISDCSEKESEEFLPEYIIVEVVTEAAE